METTNRTNQLHGTNNTDLFSLELSSSSEDEDHEDFEKDSPVESENPSNGPRKCRECGLSFDLYQTLQLHILNVHRIDRAAFNSSEEEYVEESDNVPATDDTDEPLNVVGSDPDEVPDPKPFKCKQCTKCFMIAKHLEMHMQVHELKQKTEAAYRGAAAAMRGSVHECRFCHAPQRSVSGLRAHERRHLRVDRETDKLKIPPKKRRGRLNRSQPTKSPEIRVHDNDENEDKESDEWSNED